MARRRNRCTPSVVCGPFEAPSHANNPLSLGNSPFEIRDVSGSIALIMAFSGAFVKPFRPAFDAGLAAAAVPWYLAGGAPTPIAVYQPKGAASLAASYVNLVNPGTYNAAPGVAPTLVANGWSFNGTSQYLTTGIVPASGYSAVISFTGAENNLTFLTCFGEYDVGAHFFIGITGAPVNVATFGSGGENTSVPGGGLAAGTMAIAGNTAYINGVAKATIPAWQKSATLPIYLGAYNSPTWLYVPYSTFCAAAIWDTSTNHATWMPAVMAAVALI